jgi:hypothetical protein
LEALVHVIVFLLMYAEICCSTNFVRIVCNSFECMCIRFCAGSISDSARFAQLTAITILFLWQRSEELLEGQKSHFCSFSIIPLSLPSLFYQVSPYPPPNLPNLSPSPLPQNIDRGPGERGDALRTTIKAQRWSRSSRQLRISCL